MKTMTRPLSQRLKKNELYVVFNGFDFSDGTISLICYGDPDRTPRIYKRESFDDRLDPAWPVCRTFRSAIRRTKGKTLTVMLPLFEMVRIFGPRNVKKWASIQGHVTPEEVREYVKRFVALPQSRAA